MMDALARALGDFESLIAVKSADLSTPYAYLDIAETCRSAGHAEAAIHWAEEGISTYPEAEDVRLHDFLADRYQEARRPADAVALAWTAFAARPNADRFKTLQRHARSAESWPEWRDRALQSVRDRLVAAKHAADEVAPTNERSGTRSVGARRHLVALPDPRRYAVPPVSGSTLVEMLLVEGAVAAAWEAAKEFGCRDELWLHLANRREGVDADGAIAVYKREVSRLLGAGLPKAYPEVVALVGQVAALLVDSGRRGDASDYLAELQIEFGRKRSFVKLLDAERTLWNRRREG